MPDAQPSATGRRKTSVARVHLRPGTGEFQLNDQGLDEYFGGIEALKQVVKQPFSVTETNDLAVSRTCSRISAGKPSMVSRWRSRPSGVS